MLSQPILYPFLTSLIILLISHSKTYTTELTEGTNTLKHSFISPEEQKIQEIEHSIENLSSKKNTNKRTEAIADYVFNELTNAVRNKHSHVIDYLLSSNFRNSSHLLSNFQLACMVGIPAARGAPEDITIIEQILTFKQNAFSKHLQIGCIFQQAQAHIHEMTVLLNRILAFSAASGHRNIVLSVLTRCNSSPPHASNIDKEGIDWALQSVMHVKNTSLRHQIISDLYQQSSIKPSITGTIDAITIAFEKNHHASYESDWFKILEWDTASTGRTIENILENTTSSIRSNLVHKLINLNETGQCPPNLQPDKKSMSLAVLKFKERNQIEIAIKINHRMGHLSIGAFTATYCEFIQHVFELYNTTDNDIFISEYHQYLSKKHHFWDNIFFLLLEKIHRDPKFRIPETTSKKLKNVCDDMLVDSAKFGDYETGTELLDKKYYIIFDTRTLLTAIENIDSGLEKPTDFTSKKRKRGMPSRTEPAATTTEQREATPSKREIFLQQLIARIK